MITNPACFISVSHKVRLGKEQSVAGICDRWTSEIEAWFHLSGGVKSQKFRIGSLARTATEIMIASTSGKA
jgi:hypothetical protein